MITRLILAGVAATTLLSQAALAAVSPEEAKKLGTVLTPLGAEMAGNKDGSIPAYTGGLTTPPPNFVAGSGIRPDPFASEKPLFRIDGKNMDKYADKLAEQSKFLLKKYPDYYIDVFPTHRTVAQPKYVHDNTLQNAVRAKTINNGLDLEGAFGGTAFPIPKDGYEVMWNHLTRFPGYSLHAFFNSYNVDTSGRPFLATIGDAYAENVYYDPSKTFDTFKSGLLTRLKIVYTAPARRAGEGLLVWEPVNMSQTGRRAWQYLPGQRRVKLAPDISYDTPNPGAGGASTYDDAFLYNGLMDRFDFKLIGKKELYVPYNTYKLTYAPTTEEVLGPHFVKPEYQRWELHRVWQVEADLKAGSRHLYSKRVFYIDEDGWAALLADEYDKDGQLYRGGYANLTESYDVPCQASDTFGHYDFISSIYNINGHFGGKPLSYQAPPPDSDWTPDALAASGIR
jgi:hypothetical protein